MLDLVVRPVAGLLICAAIGAVIFYLPELIRWARAWLDREDPRDVGERMPDRARQSTSAESSRQS
jgi:hypothetical protein